MFLKEWSEKIYEAQYVYVHVHKIKYVHIYSTLKAVPNIKIKVFQTLLVFHALL